MLEALDALLKPAVMQRLTLGANHVLSSEPVATDRLKAHSGRCIRLHFNAWPRLLPQPPVLAFRVSPAGLLEWVPDDPASDTDLLVNLDGSNPALLLARLASGESPQVEVQGDAALAADVSWLLDNLRWDAEADLARVIDPRLARPVAQAASAMARALRTGLRSAFHFSSRWRPSAA